jgi:hypothetical protein
MSRLTIDMTDQQHRSLLALAAQRGKTVGEYAIERLFPVGAGEEEQAWRELKAVLEGRVAQGLAGGISPRTIRAIVDDELGLDGPD